jgi:HAE1 family hydrophobic/amphiphilic exporter-1
MNQENQNIPEFLSEFNSDIEEVAKIKTVPSSVEEDNHPGSLLMFFLKHTRLTILMIVAIVLIGLFALFNLKIEANPEISQPIGVVQTFYPNSSPADVESQITKIIEEQLIGLSQLKELTSISSNNLSTITATFESNANTAEVIQDLKDAVSKIEGALPDDASNVEVLELDFNDTSIVSYSLTGPMTKLDLTEYSDVIIDQIKDVSGVSKVELSGDVTQSIKVVLDTVKMEFYNLSISQVVQALNSSNINAPLGSITKNKEEINLRLLGKITDIETLKNTPILNTSGEKTFSVITLADIADIELSVDESDTDSFVSDNKTPAQSAVTLNVFKQKGGNIIDIVNSIQEKVEEITLTLPEGVKIIKTNDNAYFIKSDISTLSVSGLQTILIIFFALMIFLTAREAFITAIAIPLIFLITFGFIYMTGQTLNGLTIFSLILSLGLIVDTSIVIVEGIHDGRKEGLNSYEAAKKSLTEFKWPLVAGTATTLAAFAPMLLVSGIVGDFIKTIPIVLSITLLSSLFVSFLITPLLGRIILKKAKNESRIHEYKEGIIQKLQYTYEHILGSILRSRAKKIIVVSITLVAFLISMTLPIFGVLKTQLFPVVDVPFIFVNFEAPIGTELEDTRELARPIEETLKQFTAIDNYTLNLGRKISADFEVGASSIRSYQGHFFINLLENKKEREVSYLVTKNLREELEALNSPLDISVEEVSSGPPVSAPFEARISGPDLRTLEQISKDVTSILEGIDGYTNIANEFDDSPDEVRIILDQDKLSYYGVTNQQVALVLQGFSVGIDGGKIEIKGEDYDIKVYLEGSETKNYNDLASFQISTRVGNIPLSYLGEVVTDKSIKSIPRIDEARTVRVRAYINEDVLVADLLPETQEKLDALDYGTEYQIKVGGESEDVQESFTELFSSMIIAVILIIVILVLIFNSFRQTFVVLASLPLAVIGIFPGLAFLSLPLSFPAFLGVVMLTGIVVNDAIVLIDQVNKNRETDELVSSVISGAKSRLIPIILTSITTILGLIPVTLTDEFWRGLGYSVIFGLFTATFLTLFIIPILYTLVYRKQS